MFAEATVFALLAWTVLAAGCARHLLARRSGERDERPPRGSIGALPLLLPWIAVPVAVILGYSVLKRPIYLDRYLVFLAPGVALLLAMAVQALTRTRIGAAALLTAFAVLAVPPYLAQRGPWPKPDGMDFSQLADALAASSRPGDCVLFERDVSWNPTSMRVTLGARPDAFRGLVDIGRGRTAVQVGDFWDENLPPAAVAPRLTDCPAVWLLTEAERTAPLAAGPTHGMLVGAGFRVAAAQQIHVSQLVRYVPIGRN
jgi:mannosyltransferase